MGRYGLLCHQSDHLHHEYQSTNVANDVHGFEGEFSRDEEVDSKHQSRAENSDSEENHRDEDGHSRQLPGSERSGQEQAGPPLLATEGLDDEAQDDRGHHQEHPPNPGCRMAWRALVADGVEDPAHHRDDSYGETQGAEEPRPEVGELSSQRVPHGVPP